MKEDYERQVQKLVKLVDGATDVVDFVRVSGECVEMSRIYLSRNALRWEATMRLPSWVSLTFSQEYFIT